jgi:uncharacterized protein (TIGR02996 family)
MISQEQAFLEAILERPDDDTPRLIFADWLEERGDPSSAARAEFIRVQCILAGERLPPRRQAELTRREQQILNDWDEEWVRPLHRLVKNWEFHRGFIHYVGLSMEKFLTHAGRLFRRAPVRHLRLWPHSLPSIEPMDMALLADNVHLTHLLSLDLSENRLASTHLRALVVSEHLTNLTELDLSFNRIGDGGLRALAASPLLGRLQRLNLCGNDVGVVGLRALAHALEEWNRSAAGLRLQRLELFAHDLSTAGQRILTDSPLLRWLVRV